MIRWQLVGELRDWTEVSRPRGNHFCPKPFYGPHAFIFFFFWHCFMWPRLFLDPSSWYLYFQALEWQVWTFIPQFYIFDLLFRKGLALKWSWCLLVVTLPQSPFHAHAAKHGFCLQSLSCLCISETRGWALHMLGKQLSSVPGPPLKVAWAGLELVIPLTP